MRALLHLVIAGSVVALSPLARAEEPAQKAPAAEKAPHDRVHLGATSVTVVDEHETVDDVITRLRSAKSQTGTATKTKVETPPPTAPAGKTQHQEGRATLQHERESAAAHADADRPRDERRERGTSTRLRSEKKQRR